MKRNYVFVYGTLKSGHYNHRAISIDKTAKLVIDDAFIAGKMFDLGAYPAVVPSTKNVSKGEVWEVSDETMDRLDHLEGHPSYYTRQEVPLMGGVPHWTVWAYLMKPETLPGKAVPMPVGNWPLKR